MRESAIRLRVYMKHTLHESVYISFLTASLSLLDFLGNICIYSHVIELVTHMLDCHDLASAGHYWMMRIRGDLEVGIRNADW